MHAFQNQNYKDFKSVDFIKIGKLPQTNRLCRIHVLEFESVINSTFFEIKY